MLFEHRDRRVVQPMVAVGSSGDRTFAKSSPER
jgi:hypothetical protein